MKANRKMTSKDDIILLNNLDRNFASLVKAKSGVNLNLCLHCLTCSGGCPVSDAMEYNPNGIIRLVQLGFKEESLKSSDIWLCLGCHTCSMQCPQAIDIAALMDALREIAIKEKVVIAEPDILNFHKEVINSIKRYGRTHKLEIMLRYKIQKMDWFSDFNIGIRMLAKRKLDLMPSRIKKINVIKELVKQSKVK